MNKFNTLTRDLMVVPPVQPGAGGQPDDDLQPPGHHRPPLRHPAPLLFPAGPPGVLGEGAGPRGHLHPGDGRHVVQVPAARHLGHGRAARTRQWIPPDCPDPGPGHGPGGRVAGHLHGQDDGGPPRVRQHCQ